MSRYFQSSYHGSNDYKKYRQEKLNRNNDLSKSIDKKCYEQAISYRSEISQNTQRQHLQTFGKQKSYQFNQRRNCQNSFVNDRLSSKNNKVQNLSSQPFQFSTKREYNFEAETSLRNKDNRTNTYLDSVYEKSNYLRNTNQQIKANTLLPSENSRLSSKYNQDLRNKLQLPTKYEPKKQGQAFDEFQDSIITRRKHYGNLNDFRSDEVGISSKSYNYSNKIDNFGKSNIEIKNLILSKQKPHIGEPLEQAKTDNKYKSKFQHCNNVPTTSPYRNRNQMIKQRLNMQIPNQIYKNRTIRNQTSFNNDKQQDLSARKLSYTYQAKTAQVTPQKSGLTPREDRNASQQRRKSLIQKSQMLKQKLNRLNGSSNTKVLQNQQNCSKNQINGQKQNKTPQRYLANSFNLNCNDSSKIEKSITKKLNFDELSSNYIEPLNLIDRNSNEKIKRNYQPSLVTKVPNQLSYRDIQPSLCSQSVGEGALKKISQLNERINSRLESILKNYG